MDINSIIVKNKDVEVTSLNNEKVMMNMEKGLYFALNEIGSVIWDLIGENTSIIDIINKLLEEYEVDEEVCRNEVLSYLNELSQQELVFIN